MKIHEIMEMPTEIDGVHESVYRAYNILDYVKMLLSHETQGHVVYELIKHMENGISDRGPAVCEKEQPPRYGAVKSNVPDKPTPAPNFAENMCINICKDCNQEFPAPSTTTSKCKPCANKTMPDKIAAHNVLYQGPICGIKCTNCDEVFPAKSTAARLCMKCYNVLGEVESTHRR